MSIATEITRLRNAKEAIKTSIINKGVAVSDTAKLDEYPNFIDNIKSGEKIDEYFETYTGGPFTYCIIKIPFKNTAKVNDMNYAFSGYTSLIEIPELDASNVVNIINCFFNCFKLTIFGGFKNLGQAYSTTASANNSAYTLNLSSCKNLTHESLILYHINY